MGRMVCRKIPRRATKNDHENNGDEIVADAQEITPLPVLCTDCSLGEQKVNKSNCISYVGPENPKIIFVGDAPEEDEDELGRPFVGRVGMMLRWLVKHALLNGKYPYKLDIQGVVDDVYHSENLPLLEDEYGLINTTRCRPPHDKPPTAKQFKTCFKYTQADIEKYKPECIVLLGGIAFQAFTGSTGVLDARGTVLAYTCEDGTEIPVVVTVHPSYVMRNRTEQEYNDFRTDVSKAFDIVYHGINHSVQLPKEPHYINTMESAKWLFDLLSQQEVSAIDIETNDTWSDDIPVSPFTPGAAIVGISFAWSAEESAFLPFEHPESPWRSEHTVPSHTGFIAEPSVVDPVWSKSARDWLVYKVNEYLQNPNIKKLAHNGKFDFSYLQILFGARVQNFYMDTMLAHHLLDERRGTHGLKRLALKYTKMGGYDKELSGKINSFRLIKDRSLWNVDLKSISRYGGWDGVATFRLFLIFQKQLTEEKSLTKTGDSIQLWDFFQSLVMPAAMATMDMELTGTFIDPVKLQEADQKVGDSIASLEAQMLALPEIVTYTAQKLEENPSYELNLGSTAQLGEILYILMGITPRRTPKGNFSVTAEILNELSQEPNPSPIIPMLVSYKKQKHIRDTYISPYIKPGRIDHNHRVHTSYLLHGTVTGRLSSKNPNLQNIPRGTTAADIKQFFTASPGNTLIQADYSQIELRVLAIYSEDELMLQAYRNNQDLHTFVSSMLFGIPIEKVGKPLRQVGKTLNFGLVYGMGIQKLAGEFMNLLNIGTLTIQNLKSAFSAAQQRYSVLQKEKPYVTGLYPKIWYTTYETTSDLCSELAKLVFTLHKAIFEGLNRFAASQVIQAIENSYVNTLFGRKRRLTDLTEDLLTVLGDARSCWSTDISERRKRVKAYNKKHTSKLINQVTDDIQWVKNSVGKLTKIVIPIDYQHETDFLINFLNRAVKPTYLKDWDDTIAGITPTKVKFLDDDRKVQYWNGKYRSSELAESMRVALNAPIQGSASDICLFSLTRLTQILQEKQYSAKIVLTVHDSILIDCPASELQEVLKLTRSVMEDLSIEHNKFSVNLNWWLSSSGEVTCPIVVDLEYGNDWYNLTPWVTGDDVKVQSNVELQGAI